jgi:hypothetical protein
MRAESVDARQRHTVVTLLILAALLFVVAKLIERWSRD